MFGAVLIPVVAVLAVAGLVLWAIQQLPIDTTIAAIIRVVVIVAVCLWLIGMFVGRMPIFFPRHP